MASRTINLVWNMATKVLFFSLIFLGDTQAQTDQTNSANKPSRDWKTYPAIVQISTKENVFAIGDAHADPSRLANALLASGLISAVPKQASDAKWTGAKAILIVTGDMIDKWKESLSVIALLRALQADAAKQGGQVILSMGNHEAEFLADATRKKTKEFASELTAAGLDPNAVGSCQGDLGTFLCQLPIGVKVNDWFFSHAGNTHQRTIAELETAIQQGFAKDGFATAELVGDDSLLEARLNKKGPNGMAWFMDGKASNDPQKILQSYAEKLGVKHIVQGHQPGKVKFPDGKNREADSFFQRYGLLFLIDSGMSQGIEDSTSIGGVLRISGGGSKAAVICPNKATETLWSKSANQDLQAVHCQAK